MLEMFTQASSVTTLLFLSLTIFLGTMVGRIKFGAVSLGAAGVLFCGILLGHLGFPIDNTQATALNFIRDFGLILFVYSIGIDTGPRFFSSFKSDGLKLNTLAVLLIVGTLATTLCIFYNFDINAETAAGIMSGAVTNTPGLGAAQQVLESLGHDPSSIGTGYAIAYPFGVIGIILVLILTRVFFRIDIKKEASEYQKSLSAGVHKLQSVEVTVKNENIFGRKMADVKQIVDSELVVSRIFRENDYLLATDDEVIEEGDVLYGVADESAMERIRIKLGDLVVRERRNVNGKMDLINVLVTNKQIAGKTIEQIGIYRRYEANITRIYRSGVEILPTLHSTLELGDTVRVIGANNVLNEVKNELGNSTRALAIPNMAPMFIGIFLGLLVGAIPVAIPGLPVPAKLGLAGGPLLIAILLGYKGRWGTLNFYLTPAGNMMLQKMGIVLFLGAVGLMAGGRFADTLMNGGYVWMCYGAFITFVPAILIAVAARLLKINYLKICGLIAGATTNPPVLEFANGLTDSPAQSSAYATVYPLSMFLRILVAQILLFIII